MYDEYIFDEEISNKKDYEEETPWRPEVAGETLIGEYLYKKENVGVYNQTVYVFRGQDETLYSIFSNKVLQGKLQECNEGDILLIKYEGIPEGKKYKNFTVKRGRIAHPDTSGFGEGFL